MVELLIALAIAGMLLAALTVALNASIVNYRENEEIFKGINSARQALTRMTSEIRTAGADVNGIFLSVDPCAPSNQCNLYTANGESITYEFRSPDPNLYLITNSNGNEYVLCDNVVSATFTKTPADSDNSKSVQIVLTVQSGNHQQNLAAAAVVRKVLDR